MKDVLHLKWKRTGLGGPDDFIARDPERPRAYCRIYKSSGTSSDRAWFWTASDGHLDLGTGYAATAKEAAELAEAAYWRRREPSDGHGVP
jgi:hypothetical protein